MNIRFVRTLNKPDPNFRFEDLDAIDAILAEANAVSESTVVNLNPYADLIARLRSVPDDADNADLRKLAAEIRSQVPESSNPKDRIGQAKVSLSKISPVAQLHEAMAMMDGAGKYGPYNWREHTVGAMVYIDAIKRHIDSWAEREEEAPDSHVHHLGHARAGLGILLDAQAHHQLLDDRPPSNGEYVALLAKMNTRGHK
jgi:hypothetical protein